MRRLLAALPLLAIACDEPDIEAPYRAQVAALIGLDSSTEAGRYEIRVRDLTTVTDLHELEGPYLRLRRGGLIGSEQLEGGDPPQLRYDVVDGVIVPRDYPTLVMLSAYHQFERVFAELPRLTGETIDEIGRGRAKLDVFFEPSIANAFALPFLTSNAAYLPGRRQFMLLRRSDAERVPIAADLHVIAHEFGHLVFEHTFFGDTATACVSDLANASKLFPGRLASEYALRGMNEGFADFFAFAGFGGTNTLAAVVATLPERSIKTTRFGYDDIGTGLCRGEFYCIGTLFARSLYETLSVPDDADARGVLSRQVVSSLRTLAGRLEADPSLLPDPSFGVRICSSVRDPVYDGRVAGAFLDAFLQGLPTPVRDALCVRLSTHFGETGFPREARRACAASP